MALVNYRKVDVDGTNIFYREAGRQNPETILLLHGFPTASHMFRDLIPLLADQYRLIAPDLPGFGQSDMPPRETFSYTFDNLAKVIRRFTEVVHLERFAIYIFDYGAPVGLRIALEHPRTHYCDHLPKWQCVRRRAERRMESDPRVLEGSDAG